LLIATKLLTAKLHSRFVKKSVSEIAERSELESDILPPTPQPWLAINAALTAKTAAWPTPQHKQADMDAHTTLAALSVRSKKTSEMKLKRNFVF